MNAGYVEIYHELLIKRDRVENKERLWQLLLSSMFPYKLGDYYLNLPWKGYPAKYGDGSSDLIAIVITQTDTLKFYDFT
jgi:hypothetical protein